MGHKEGANLFLSVTLVKKSSDFNVIFTVRFWNERHVKVWTSPTSPNWCCYSTLWKSKHRKCNKLITAGYHQRKLHQMYHSFIKVDQGHHVPYIYLLGVLYSKACMKQGFTTSTTYENTWCKLVLTLTGTSSTLTWPSEIMCVCWWWTLWTHALTWMFICIIHQNILWNCM